MTNDHFSNNAMEGIKSLSTKAKSCFSLIIIAVVTEKSDVDLIKKTKLKPLLILQNFLLILDENASYS